METKNKRLLLIITIIILLIINVSALLTFIYKNKVRTKQYAEISRTREEMREKGMRRYFQDELNLSESQINDFKDINTKYSGQSRIIAENLEHKRYEMMIELANLNPNDKELDKIAKEIGKLHYELKKLTIKHFVELKEICNEEQQEALNKMFFRMLSTQDGEHMNKAYRRERGKFNDKPRQRNRNRNSN